MKYFLIIASLTVFIVGCDFFQGWNMNEPSRPIEELKILAIDSGNISAYNALGRAYLYYEHGAFFKYAKQMADKYNYPKAYYDTYIQLLKPTDSQEATISLDSCDSKTRKLAIKYLQKSWELGFEPSGEELEYLKEKGLMQ